jgi:hypothetical protein
MNTSTRFRIVGIEIVGLGAFLLTIIALELEEAHFDMLVRNFGWVYGIIGFTLILVGLETLSLIRNIPSSR